jgi:hypothetical protein
MRRSFLAGVAAPTLPGLINQEGTPRSHARGRSTTSGYSSNNRAELERRLGHANDRYLRLYTNPPEEIAAGFVEDL